MFEKKRVLAVIVLLAGVILWIITNNVVFFILGITTFASQQRAV